MFQPEVKREVIYVMIFMGCLGGEGGSVEWEGFGVRSAPTMGTFGIKQQMKPTSSLE